jgi:hypothetical protein
MMFLVMSIKAVLDAAKAEVGYKEGANNSNKFAKVAGHANNQPWCATFIRACFIKGKEEKAIPNSAYCPHIESWARANHAVISERDAKAGDLALFDFSRNGKAEHIGILIKDFDPKKPDQIRTIEGNTSGSKSGSQSNGDSVARKTRPISNIRVIVRPKWSKE